MKSENPLVIAERLRLLQATNGWTIQEMADRSGLPKRSLENYMSLKAPQRPGLDALISIATGLEVTLDWLTGLTEMAGPEHPQRRHAAVCAMAAAQRMLESISKYYKDRPSENDVVAGKQINELATTFLLDFLETYDWSGQRPEPEVMRDLYAFIRGGQR